jgi:hypothetical protein
METQHQPTMQARADAALRALDALRADLRHLTTATGRIHRPTPAPSPDQIAAAGRRHLAERADTIEQMRRGITPIGSSPAPGDLTITSTLARVDRDLAVLVRAVQYGLGDTPAPIRPRLTTTGFRLATGPEAHITRLVRLVPRAAAYLEVIDHVLGETRRIHGSVRWALGDAEEVRTLPTRCYICGAKSLRAFPARGIIRCVNASCRCDTDGCGCSDTDRPTRHWWPASDRDALDQAADDLDRWEATA